MREKNTSSHPAYATDCQKVAMRFSSALIFISRNEDSICRRKIWGCSIRHVYIENSGTEGERLILVNDLGKLDDYIPSIDDLTAHDWLAG